jgi:SAM-dependent methyltransferase
MVRVVRAKAARTRSAVHATVSSVEELSADSAGFDLVTVGNAFHRLHRDQVARRVIEWLRPGGRLALCWSSSPWTGHADWQKTLSGLLDRWRNRLGTGDRIPRDWVAAREARPDQVVVTDAGFESLGRYEFQTEHRWTVTELAGFTYSTSFLAAPVLGERAAEFEADLDNHLRPHGELVDQVSSAYDLFGKPAR